RAIGLMVCLKLKDLDEVAYLRFASVYRNYDSLEDFEAEITLLRSEAALAATSPESADAVSASSTLPTLS
ncbi:MAG: transcriptional regulator NrdR, partial [Actinomycetota bacterium]